MAYTYDYPHPAVTVDVAVFTVTAGRLAVVLVRRAEWPHAGKWAIPGGFVEIDESLKRAALRELREETGLKAGFLEQLVVYISLAPFDRLCLEAGSDAADAKLFFVDDLPELAFDHARILGHAVERLRDRLGTGDVVQRLMPESFTLTELQQACEAVGGAPIDKRNFRKKLKALELVEATGEDRRDGPHRPAKLFRACL